MVRDTLKFVRTLRNEATREVARPLAHELQNLAFQRLYFVKRESQRRCFNESQRTRPVERAGCQISGEKRDRSNANGMRRIYRLAQTRAIDLLYRAPRAHGEFRGEIACIAFTPSDSIS